MIKFVKRKAELKACPRCLANRVRYIANQGHNHHLNKKVVMPSRNYGCRGDSPLDFLTGAKEAYDLGQLRIKSRQGGGNPTPDLFLELIYASPDGSNPTAEEREWIRTKLLAPFKGCYIREGWHAADLENPNRPKKCKDIDDHHALISARDRFGNATMNRFGDGKQTFKSWADAMDQEICDMLNATRTVEFEPVHVVHRENLGELLGTKLTKLFQLIAHSTSVIVTRANLAAVIEQLTKPSDKNPKEEVPLAKVTNDLTLQDDKGVWVHYTGRQKPRFYRIEKLLLNIAEAQLDLELNDQEEDFSGGGSSGSGGSGSGGSGGSMPPTETETVDTTHFHPMPAHPVPVAKKAAKKAARKRAKSKTKDIPPEPQIT